MEDKGTGEVTMMLRAIERGDKDAAADLLPLVYDELRKLADARMAALAPGQTLQPTALVHEAYLRIVGSDNAGWNSRGHFFGAAARAMRNILVDQARKKSADRHGGAHKRVELIEGLVAAKTGAGLVELDEALAKLEESDRRKATIVMLKFFAGLTIDEIARALDISTATVERDWSYSRAWLYRELKKEDGSSA